MNLDRPAIILLPNKPYQNFHSMFFFLYLQHYQKQKPQRYTKTLALKALQSVTGRLCKLYINWPIFKFESSVQTGFVLKLNLL